MGSVFGAATQITFEKPFALGRRPFLRIDNGTERMNVNGDTTGTPTVLWNGTGAGDTGGDWTAGSQGSETAGSMRSGTNGWDTGVAAINTQTVFNNGSMVDVDGTYTLLRFWIQPKAYPPGSNLRLRWVDSSNSQVGGQVNINDYVADMDLDVWQRVSIPIEDWNLTGNVQKLQFRYRAAAGQHFYYDDIELLPPGDGPYKFRIRPPVGFNYHLSMAVLEVTAPESGWNNDAFGNISGGLDDGLIFRQRRLSDGETLWRFVTKDNRQLFGQYHPQESFAFADSTLLVGFMVKPGKATVIATNDEVLEFAVRDDLSSLTDMRAYLHYGVEDLA